MHHTFCSKEVARLSLARPWYGLPILSLTCLALASAGAQAADAFGTQSPSAQATADLRDRLVNLEHQLEELKRNRTSAPGVAPVAAEPGMPGNPGRSADASRPGKPAAAPAITGYEDLPSGGSDRNEVLQIEGQLQHEVIGTVNGMKLVRDGESVFAMTDKEFKAFEVARRKEVVRKFNIEAAKGAVSSTGASLAGSTGAQPSMPPAPTPMAFPARQAQPMPVPPAPEPPAPTKPAESKAPGAK